MGQLVLLMQGGSGCILLCLLHLPVILLHRWDNHTSAIPACIYLRFCSRDGAATAEARRKGCILIHLLYLPVVLLYRWNSQLLMQEGR